MDETKAMARLPSLDIDITHRRSPDGNTEYLSITLRASPSFDAAARLLSMANPMLPWMAMGSLAPWMRAVQTAWTPWLTAMSGAGVLGSATGRRPGSRKTREES